MNIHATEIIVVLVVFYAVRIVSRKGGFFLIGRPIVGGEVQLGPLGTAVTNRPIVPALGDYDNEEIGGMMIGR
jgi:hypothetical protein